MRLRRPDPAGVFLGVALTRRCARRRYEPDEMRVEVDRDGRPDVQVRTADSDRPTARWYPEPDFVVPVEPPPAGRPGGHPQSATSAAVRIAEANAITPLSPSPVVEAVIAWLHAYETFVRYRRVAAAASALTVLVVLLQLRDYGAPF